MPATTHEEQLATKALIDKCRTYLLDNFHKFTDNNKIKISISLLMKAMPLQIEGEVKGGDTKVVVYVENKQDADKSKAGRLPASFLVEPS